MEWILLVVVIVVAAAAVTFGYMRTRRDTKIPIEAKPKQEPPLARPQPAPSPDVEIPAPTAGVDVAVAPEPSVEVAPEPEAEPEPITKPRLRDRLGRTKAALAGYVTGLAGRKVDQSTWDDLEEALLLADVGIDTTTKLLDAVQARVKEFKISDPDEVVAVLRAEIEGLLERNPNRDLARRAEGVSVWMFVGVNGVGKTTTIGKLAAQEVQEGRSVVLAAGDTFRAAAGEQLAQWAQRAHCEIVRGQENGDPGAVVFDAMASAQAKSADLLLVDTAGRLHNKANLMAELEKLKRIVDRTEGALQEVILVLDATTGQNGLQQAKVFGEIVDITGIALTKLDGTAKGGIVLAIQDTLNVPVKLVGVGETLGDLIEFDPREFTAGLFDD